MRKGGSIKPRDTAIAENSHFSPHTPRNLRIHGFFFLSPVPPLLLVCPPLSLDEFQGLNSSFTFFLLCFSLSSEEFMWVWSEREGMSRRVCANLKLCLLSLVLIQFYVEVSNCSTLNHLKGPDPVGSTEDGFFPMISPQGSPQPFIPFLAPSPLVPFSNGSIHKLSGLCPLNFSASEAMMSVTSTDCFSTFAPYLANVVCCPQLEATLTILVGKSSKHTKVLALNETLAKHCLLDIEQVLVNDGANDNLHQICEVKPANLTEGTCPVRDVDEFESMVDTSRLRAACGKLDVVNECCTQLCENTILESSQKIASKATDVMSGSQNTTIVDDCRRIVLRWLSSRLDASGAKQLLRGLSNCKVNKVCPLTLPDTDNLRKNCVLGMKGQKECCSAMRSYVSQLQNQSFTTNLQALNCAASLGRRLQGENVTENIYSLCHVTLKDFSVQAGSQESGCLLQSLPSDVTFDQSSGISFLCDLNDNIAAPWPSAYQLPTSSCNKTVRLPALPAAASGGYGVRAEEFRRYFVLALAAVLLVLR